MFQKISKSSFVGKGAIQILYPGRVVSNADTGIGSIGRIDHAEIRGGVTIPMHPHSNDEILSYFRSGKALHTDSEGFKEIIGKEKTMLMKAGKIFYHEETIMGENEPLEGLQIFIRPAQKDLKPEVVFFNLESLHSENAWRMIASPTAETQLQFSSQTWIYDIKLLKGSATTLPGLPRPGLTCLLYVFKGNIKVNTEMDLENREGLIFKNMDVALDAPEDAELVLFVTDEQGEIFKDGMYSGNKT